MSIILFGRGILRDSGKTSFNGIALEVTTQIVGNSVLVSWGEHPRAARYKILRSPTPDDLGILLDVVPSGTTTYTDDNPSTSTQNYYAVIGIPA
jgi:hypothetical protein